MTPPLTIPFSSIIEGSRARNAKKYGNIEGLVQSIKSVGLIQPIVLAQNADSTFSLVAGGRRYRALSTMGITSLTHGVTLRPGTPGFIFESEVPEHARKEAELDENLHRLDMDWVDNCLLVADIHESKRAVEGHKWGQRQTAELLGSGYSKSNVNYALRIAKLLRTQDKDILECSTMMDAVAVMVKRKEDEALAELQRRTMPAVIVHTQNVVEGTPTSTDSFLDTFNLKGAKTGRIGNPVNVASFPAIGVTPQSGPVLSTPPISVPLSQMFFCADAVEDKHPTSTRLMSRLLTMNQLFSHIVTDIPYGIDMENLNKKQTVDVAQEHEVEANVSMMPKFLKSAFDLVKPHGFCVFFYDLDHHEKLQKWATDIGWKVQRWPFHWIKTHACQNNAAQYNQTKCVEHAMFLRKDEHTVLRDANHLNYWVGDGAAERKLYNNPFAKPFGLWKEIFDIIAFPGQTILDPFCGEMSSCRAAANCGLIPYGIEINEKHYNRGLENMRKVFAVIHKSNVLFT